LPVAVIGEKARETFIFEFFPAIADKGFHQVPAVDEYMHNERVIGWIVLFLS
jgi:hypothetical protein